MATITVITRRPDAVRDYLGFGCREVERGKSKFDDHVVICDCPDEHAQWNAMRLGSGMHGARIVEDLDAWKAEWGYSKTSPAVARFPSGHIVATPGALYALENADQAASDFLDRHFAGDWGELDAEDRSLNEESVIDGSRILSAYRTRKGVKLWIITEAADDCGSRAATTILLPEEY